MSRRTILAYTLVGLQGSVLLLIAATGHLFARQPLWLGLEFLGIALGLWAVAAMRLKNLHVTPLVNPKAELVTSGPYRWIRHPMYLAVLLTAWSLVLDQSSPLRLLAGGLLTAVLMVKMLFEERLLRMHFPGYGDYARRTARLVPFLF